MYITHTISEKKNTPRRVCRCGCGRGCVFGRLRIMYVPDTELSLVQAKANLGLRSRNGISFSVVFDFNYA